MPDTSFHAHRQTSIALAPNTGYLLRKSNRRTAGWRAFGRLWLVVGFLLAAGCATPPPAPASKPAPPPPPSGLILLVSGRTPAFADVQREIAKRYTHRIQTHYLDRPADLDTIRKRAQSSDLTTVVAIGLPAARLAHELKGKKVVFCQVFNYEEANLVTPWMKGVAATPPAEDLFRTWKRLSPGLKKVGVITGGQLGDLLDEARAAARRHNIELEHVRVRSDKETLFAFKRLARTTQGLWLVPDNRVLSRAVIRDIMAQSVREGKQVAVFTDPLLKLGGLLSVETRASDIAERVLERVRNDDRPSDADVSRLAESDIRINSVMVKRLNLKVPRSLRGMVHAP